MGARSGVAGVVQESPAPPGWPRPAPPGNTGSGGCRESLVEAAPGGGGIDRGWVRGTAHGPGKIIRRLRVRQVGRGAAAAPRGSPSRAGQQSPGRRDRHDRVAAVLSARGARWRPAPLPCGGSPPKPGLDPLPGANSQGGELTKSRLVLHRALNGIHFACVTPPRCSCPGKMHAFGTEAAVFLERLFGVFSERVRRGDGRLAQACVPQLSQCQGDGPEKVEAILQPLVTYPLGLRKLFQLLFSEKLNFVVLGRTTERCL
ncbi:uncharacterized protein LOC133625628 [Colius striatus]|uniref:uncharacterized protein LOC133625628 n=1 Tax=Colius striatus TaxID=57412 RepID=UPI002B1D02ED|nr:uncharacterized protein LOC133625628 [Colius striatus]